MKYWFVQIVSLGVVYLIPVRTIQALALRAEGVVAYCLTELEAKSLEGDLQCKV